MQRPLSPHLSIYRPQFTSIFSILHRITGVYMFFYIVSMSLWVFLIQALSCTEICMKGLIIIATVGFIISLSYHLCAGIRYLFWGFNIGVNIESARFSASIVAVATALLSIASSFLFISNIYG